MNQHPVPRQITTFEFKLVGQLTVRQFVYLALAAGFSVSFFFLVPRILFINFLAAAIPALFGIGLAFVPINDRPMETWVRNLIKRLTSPTQYYFHKHNRAPQILRGIVLPPKEIMREYLRAKQKLAEYEFTNRNNHADDKFGQDIVSGTATRMERIISTISANHQARPATNTPGVLLTIIPVGFSRKDRVLPHSALPATAGGTMFTVNGVALSTNNIPLSNMLVYLRDNGQTVRIMKTNNQGAFSSSIPLPDKSYELVVEDPRKTYAFAKIMIDGKQVPLTIKGQHA